MIELIAFYFKDQGGLKVKLITSDFLESNLSFRVSKFYDKGSIGTNEQIKAKFIELVIET